MSFLKLFSRLNTCASRFLPLATCTDILPLRATSAAIDNSVSHLERISRSSSSCCSMSTLWRDSSRKSPFSSADTYIHPILLPSPFREFSTSAPVTLSNLSPGKRKYRKRRCRGGGDKHAGRGMNGQKSRRGAQPYDEAGLYERFYHYSHDFGWYE